MALSMAKEEGKNQHKSKFFIGKLDSNLKNESEEYKDFEGDKAENDFDPGTKNPNNFYIKFLMQNILIQQLGNSEKEVHGLLQPSIFQSTSQFILR